MLTLEVIERGSRATPWALIRVQRRSANLACLFENIRTEIARLGGRKSPHPPFRPRHLERVSQGRFQVLLWRQATNRLFGPTPSIKHHCLYGRTNCLICAVNTAIPTARSAHSL